MDAECPGVRGGTLLYQPVTSDRIRAKRSDWGGIGKLSSGAGNVRLLLLARGRHALACALVFDKPRAIAMSRFLLWVVRVSVWVGIFSPLSGADEHRAVEPAKHVSVVVIPIRDEIDQPTLFVLRRGIKQALDQKVDVLVLDMNTPGGSGAAAFEMMEAVGKFTGKTITFVNKEAMSAGAFIAASTEEIWFMPQGIIGAAAAVTSEGQDIPETMRLKINSFLRAKIRAISEGKGYRGQVISAMIDKDYELKIGDKLLKKPGELLSLTAEEAMAAYGTPPQALLGAGIANDLDALLTEKYGKNNYTVTELEVTWSEKVAQYLTGIAPVLLGLGMLALFIEFKTPGFGFFGIAGIVLLAVVFLSSYVAGLSGHEPMLVFVFGLILLVLELVFFPGVVAVAFIGLTLMIGSFLWAMTDVWPNQPFILSSDLLLVPLEKLMLAFLIAGGLLAAIFRFLPQGWIWQRLAIGGAVVGTGRPPSENIERASLIGRVGIAATSLFPSGQVEIDGARYEARLEVGFAEAGTPVKVVRQSQFNLVVEVEKT